MAIVSNQKAFSFSLMNLRASNSDIVQMPEKLPVRNCQW